VGGSASLLLELLRELQQEAEAGHRMSAASTAWCRATLSHRQAFGDALQWMLRESEAGRNQVGVEKTRLEGERKLVSTVSRDQERRLQNATSLMAKTLSDFSAESEYLSQTVEAADDTIKLLRSYHGSQAQSSSDAAHDPQGLALVGTAGGDKLGSDSAALPSDRFKDAERMLMSAIAGSEGTRDPTFPELRQVFVGMRAKMEADKGTAEQESEDAAKKYHVYADRLNASILELRSQLATVDAEAAQRKRRSAHLDGRMWDLSAIVEASKVSKAAVESACRDEAEEKERAARMIAEESRLVKAMVGKLPTTGIDWLSGDSVNGDERQGSAPALMQIASASKASTGEADGSQEIMAGLARELRAASDQANEAVLTGDQTTAPPESPLQSIREFVSLDDDDIAKASAVTVDSAQGDTDAREAKRMAIEESLCSTVLQSAKADRATSERSLAQLVAKLGVVKESIKEGEEAARYDLEQHAMIKKQLKALNDLYADTSRERDRFSDWISTRSTQLLLLATQLGQEAAPWGNYEAAQGAGALAKAFEQHEALLHQRKASAPKRRDAVEAADANLLRLLAEDADHSGRHLRWLRREADLLASLSRSRSRALSGPGTEGGGAGGDAAIAAASTFCSQRSGGPGVSDQGAQGRALRGSLGATAGSSGRPAPTTP